MLISNSIIVFMKRSTRCGFNILKNHLRERYKINWPLIKISTRRESFMNNTIINTLAHKCKNIFSNIIKKYYLLGPGLILVLVVTIASLIVLCFFTINNFINIAYQASIYIPLAIGMTFVITGGGIDLSVGSQVALISVVMSQWIIEYEFAILLVIILALGLGCILGFINGFLVATLKIPDFIVTLSMMTTFRGLAFVHSGGKVWYKYPVAFRYLGTAKWFGVLPVSIITALVITIIGSFCYHSTFFGRNTVAIGSNPETAKLVGITIKKYKILQYIVIGFLAGFSAILLSSRLDSAQASMATGYEIHIIASVIIGGTALFGGHGKIWGSLVGAVILTIVSNSMVLLGIDYFWRLVATGIIVVVAVVINLLFENVRYKIEY